MVRLILLTLSVLYVMASVRCMYIHSLITRDCEYSAIRKPQYSFLELKEAPSPILCPASLQYPEYRTGRRCLQSDMYDWVLIIITSIIWPCRVLSSLKEQPIKPVMNEGVVFYVYSSDSCRNGNMYMQQLKSNIDSIHEKDPRVWHYYRVTE